MKKRFARGFTLIELLIVIALLGALAVGLIGAIDPFEQLKKGTDTGSRDIVNQYQTAIIRYFAVKNEVPWTVDPVATPLSDAGLSAETTANVVAAGELRSDFETIHGGRLDDIFLTGTADPPSVIVCFLPSSKSFQSDPNTKYLQNGDLAAGTLDCKSASPPGTDDCYWCIQ